MPYKDPAMEKAYRTIRRNNSKIPCPVCGDKMSPSSKICRKCNYVYTRDQNSHRWVGEFSIDPVTTGHQRAQRMYPVPEVCQVNGCYEIGKHRHHIDENPMNNSVDNISWLCNHHHRIVHWRKIEFVKDMIIESQTPRPTIECTNCGIRFRQPSSRLSKFCSLKCYRDYRKLIAPLQNGRYIQKGDKLPNIEVKV